MTIANPTIAAIATAPGRGGVGVIRLSGKDLLPLAHSLSGGKTPVPRRALYTDFIDEHGQAYLHTDAGLGLVHTLDMHVLADALEAGHWPEPEALPQAELGPRFGFVVSPQALASDAA